jgi:DNA (cytosine-5)-methyltransferase 1
MSPSYSSGQVGLYDNDKTFDALAANPPLARERQLKTYIDLFCGIGGFHEAASSFDLECVFACDIDAEARKAYEHNYGLAPFGDLTGIPDSKIPDHDILFAGFPCQPFSIIGSRKALDDPRGGLYKEIIRIIESKRPEAVLLENVKQLATINHGRVLSGIEDDIRRLGYHFEYRVLNALNFGVPQKRERVIMVAARNPLTAFQWPEGGIKMKPLSKILEENPDSKHFVSGRIKRSRKQAHSAECKPAIWHENKSGNISSYPYSCALRAGASYNYLLVDGERRLTPREMLRLQGFPDSFKIVCNDSQTRKQSGNAVPVPMIKAVLGNLLDAYR